MFEKALAGQSVRELNDSELDKVGGGTDLPRFTESELEIGGPESEIRMIVLDDWDDF